jgi:hypothetical protein
MALTYVAPFRHKGAKAPPNGFGGAGTKEREGIP